MHDGDLRVMGLPVKSDATHKRLVKRLRDFTVKEVGRVLNRILKEPDAHGEVISRLVSEDLDFRHGGLSATSNRIVQRAGCGVVDAASRKTRSLFVCVSCGLKLHADVNAARVILGAAAVLLGWVVVTRRGLMVGPFHGGYWVLVGCDLVSLQGPGRWLYSPVSVPSK